VAEPVSEPVGDPVPVPSLTRDERDRLERVADVMIPASAAMPSARAVGIAGDLVDWVLGARPDQREPVRRALAGDFTDRAVTDVEEYIAALRRDDRDAYHAVVFVVIAGYYHHPDVCARLGYPGQVPKAIATHAFPEYVSEGLLDFLLTPDAAPAPPAT